MHTVDAIAEWQDEVLALAASTALNARGKHDDVPPIVLGEGLIEVLVRSRAEQSTDSPAREGIYVFHRVFWGGELVLTDLQAYSFHGAESSLMILPPSSSQRCTSNLFVCCLYVSAHDGHSSTTRRIATARSPRLTLRRIDWSRGMTLIANSAANRCGSSMILSPLVLLHSRCTGTRLCSAFDPPLERGMVWSTVPNSGCVDETMSRGIGRPHK